MKPEISKVNRFNLLTVLAKFGLEKKISIAEPQAIPQFANFAASTLAEALSNPALLHGRRTEAMFEAMLISLGNYRLLKSEDQGQVYPSNDFQPPDFRVVLPDGIQWLIEVKNVYIDDPLDQRKRFMTRDYRQKLENYASSTAGHLKLAVYWAKWGMWTLVSPEKFLDSNGIVSLDLKSGMFENELGCLGDRFVFTRPPLTLRLEADPESTKPVFENGTLEFTIGDVRVYSGHKEILAPSEKEIAWILMRFGEWTEIGPRPLFDNNQVMGIEFRWEPESGNDQEMESIGVLSKMFSRYYAEQTLQGHQVVQLSAPLRPGSFAPFIASDYKGRTLPLSTMRLMPKSGSASFDGA